MKRIYFWAADYDDFNYADGNFKRRINGQFEFNFDITKDSYEEHDRLFDELFKYICLAKHMTEIQKKSLFITSLSKLV